MCSFMDTGEDKLKDVILELKLESLTKDIENLIVAYNKDQAVIIDSITDVKVDIKEILVHVRETNGRVAKVASRINEVEREEYAAKIAKLSKETSFWRTLTNHKWIAIFIGISLWAMTFKEIRDIVLTWLNII